MLRLLIITNLLINCNNLQIFYFLLRMSNSSTREYTYCASTSTNFCFHFEPFNTSLCLQVISENILLKFNILCLKFFVSFIVHYSIFLKMETFLNYLNPYDCFDQVQLYYYYYHKMTKTRSKKITKEIFS